MRIFSEKRCRENKNMHFIFNNPFSEKYAGCETIWKNIVEPVRPWMAIWPVRIACWIPKAADRHTEYVILIAFPLQQWLHERA
jgi:hypothetical protein